MQPAGSALYLYFHNQKSRGTLYFLYRGCFMIFSIYYNAELSHANFAYRLRSGHFRSSNSISVQTKPTIFVFYKSLCRFSSSLVKDMSVISRFLLDDGIGKAIFFSLFSIHTSAILFKQANRVQACWHHHPAYVIAFFGLYSTYLKQASDFKS